MYSSCLLDLPLLVQALALRCCFGSDRGMALSFLPCLFIFTSLLQRIISDAEERGTCDYPFLVDKHTVVTSDSQRDCESAFLIFPEIEREDTSKFHDGECAYQCKLELPFSCFKLHAPQTQYDEGLLHIETLEHIVSEKWKSVMNGNLKYDPFFDYNMAFWVQSLDDFITHWQSQDIDLEYFGIQWELPSDLSINLDDASYLNNEWYSILIHPPHSSSSFEFISFSRPSFYDDIRWIKQDIPRCTFQSQLSPSNTPWTRSDGATIVPLRISRATSDMNKIRNFYSNVLGANLLFVAASGDDNAVFLTLPDSDIELQFVQRSPSDSLDSASFDIAKYEELLVETHESIMTSPFCGQSRWMDNHFEYSTWTQPGLLDVIYLNLQQIGTLYHVTKSDTEHVSEHTRAALDGIGFEGNLIDSQSICIHSECALSETVRISQNDCFCVDRRSVYSSAVDHRPHGI